jgi:hypothetical protein
MCVCVSVQDEQHRKKKKKKKKKKKEYRQPSTPLTLLNGNRPHVQLDLICHTELVRLLLFVFSCFLAVVDFLNDVACEMKLWTRERE